MSPKTFKNKKESTDSKRPDSNQESGSAPFSSFVDFSDNKPNLKTDPGIASTTEEIDHSEMPPLRGDGGVVDDEDDEKCKATDYVDRFDKAVIKVFSAGKQVMLFPMFIKNFIGKDGYFKSLRIISNKICSMVDDELERTGFYPFFIGSSQYQQGYACDLKIESVDNRFGNEVNLYEHNYQDMFISSYLEAKVLPLNVHVQFDIMRPKKIDHEVDSVADRDVERVFSNKVDSTTQTEEPIVQNTPMFRGRPINLDVPKLEPKIEEHHTPFIRNGRQRVSTPVNNARSASRNSSPVSLYDDEDYLVRDPDKIIPFGQQTVQDRITELQTAAAANIPDVSTLPKLLKSHNVGYKTGDNAATWYLRFNDFCLMLGIYLPPPNSMKKDSEMGNEWDSQGLPYVFYARFGKMEKVLSHILFTPDFFPKSMSDELQLNPRPYNFLRLFMALHSHAVPDLSDRVVKRPGPMKNSQSLSQYALSWVHYFDDEANVNGIEYSKFRKYCYFVDGLTSRFAVIKKFLEMEFTVAHDKMNNIPISLELRNLPSTIVSLCNVHGISMSTTPVPTNIQLVDDNMDSSVDCDKMFTLDEASVKKIQSSGMKKKVSFATPPSSDSTNDVKVQCWLCDGPHSFRQ
jgi:hypothetical protein